MTGSRTQKRFAHLRAGITLFEILIVLAILVVVAGLVLPSLSRTLRDQKLRSAAETVRVEWNRAHIKAMKTGRIHVFKYELGGRKYKIEPWIADDDALEASGPPASMSFGQPQDAPPTEAATDESSDLVTARAADGSQQLPDGITFLDGDTAAENRQAALEEEMGSAGGGGEWSRPILFFPDGVSSDAWLVVGNDANAAIRVELRGLTGLAMVGDLTATDQIGQ